MDFEQRNEMTEETFGSFIKERRERAQMSIRALANLIGTSAVYLRDIEIFNRPAPRNQDVLEKLASMACKAAVKGNNRMDITEIEALIDELLTLENPYHCPHGRPTIISMSKYELEKKFKRII